MLHYRIHKYRKPPSILNHTNPVHLPIPLLEDPFYFHLPIYAEVIEVVSFFFTFIGPCIVNVFLGSTNKMQRYTILFITVNALHVSGGFSAHHQELENCTHSIGCMLSLFAATASVGEFINLNKYIN